MTDRETNGQRNERNSPSIMFFLIFGIILYCFYDLLFHFIILAKLKG